MIPWTSLDRALAESPRLLGAYVCLAFAFGLILGITPSILVTFGALAVMWFVSPLIGRLVMLAFPTPTEGKTNAS